ncbi:hypothetical protein PCCS19_21660 [Paenibacillus sp. CCS19]|uniref:hypothetical protein n=1 Tax=Paenibacillus sp. CCS19 TaxID=3158387 RepID=UPI0025691FB0|nr:hypothetical protein [Paenibacillus cellulosilyticus]GMK39112.1 hypothetical protein PCCS19_21660 [Paenibacillus cellulosilyticus]
MMEFKKSQIEQMMLEYEEIQIGYEELVNEAVSFLGVRNNGVEFAPKIWDLYVDVKGHCWVIKIEK